MTLYYCNAQSIVNKIDELSCVASELNPDILLIVETWCHQDISDAYLTLMGYELVPELRKDRSDTTNGRGGGLLVYVKQGLDVFISDNQVDLNQYCSFKICDVSFYLLYRSPNAPPEALVKLAELVRSAPKNCFFIGDFNLPEVEWDTGESSSRAKPLLEAMEDKNMVQAVGFPTQVSGNILDLIITDIPERLLSIEPSDCIGGSDHVSILAAINISIKAASRTKPVMNWAKANFAGMAKNIVTVQWQDIFRSLSIEEKWAPFKGRLLAAVDKHVPVKPAGPLGRPPWMTREIAAALKRKRRLWKLAKANGNLAAYKEEAKAVKTLIRKSRRKFEKKLADGGNRRPFFSYVKQKTKSRPSVGPLTNSRGEKVTDDQGMANLLNSFFSSVFTKDNGSPDQQAAPMVTADIGEIKVTVNMVREKIDNLRVDSAAGPDKIGPRLLQELKEAVAPPLAEIFNSSLREGKVPEDWRCANVTPIFKKGAKADPGNYRPVSLTSVCCKLLESIIKDRLLQHFDTNQLILPSQHGFMPGRSCATNLLEFFETVTEAVDEGSPFDIIFLDFAKAFDKVPKAPLLLKLQSLGVNGQLLSWIEAWLTGRRQRVVLNGVESDWEEVGSGVPQGSILGPILFVVHINDIDLVVSMIELLKKFADDTKLGQRVRTPEQSARLQSALDALVKWAKDWGMEFNVRKCKVMHIGHANPKHKYQMDGEELSETTVERDVGVMVSNNLKPAAQCAKAALTANRVLGQITRSFHYRDRHVYIRLYKQYVLPHLEFAAVTWSPWTDADKAVLEKVQQRAIKMVSGLKGRTYEERLIELGMATLEERRHQTDMLQVYKILQGKDRVEPTQWFQLVNSNGRVTRGVADPLNLVQKRARLDLRRNFFSQRIVADWNKVPAQLKMARNAAAFKAGYRAHRAVQTLNV